MEPPSNRGRGPVQPRVHGTTVHGTHPADVAIRRARYPYAAPSPVENLLNWLVGAPIASAQAMHERLTKAKALAVFSSDALSSVAYATEEILLVLLLAGSGAFVLAGPISLVIALLLLIVAMSYRQTIHAYPKGGGSYIVAKDNLGTLPGLTAGAALLTDYVLTVAVSVSSGVSALVSAFPELDGIRVTLAVGFVLIIAVANLRGIRESSTIFMLPTYAFVVSIFALIAVGLFRYFVLGQTAAAPTDNVLIKDAVEGLGIFLLLRAFAAGCTALTGVEAISDGVPAFRPPESQNAARTLSIMATVLISMFLGITLLTHLYPVVPQADHETILSQLGHTAFGEGPAYLFLQAATTLILVLAANTSFADFPRLSYFIARDGFMPRMFVRVGQRLVFTTGILALAFLSSILIIAFGASTHNLIPLYAVGVFISFTLSQAGMIQRWRRLRGPNWQRSMVINSIGATATAIVLVILTVTKFAEGAWLIVALIPTLIFGFLSIKRHYTIYQEQVSLSGYREAEQANIIVVPVQRVDEPTLRTLAFARTISGQIIPVLVGNEPADADGIAHEWQAVGCEMPLTIPEAGTRSATQTLLKVIRQTGEQNPAARLVVILPEIAPRHLWDIFLRNRTILLLKLILLFQPNRIVVSVPYHEHEDAENGAPHGHSHTNIIIVPVARVDRAVARSLNFARTIAGNVTAVFVHYEAAEAESLLAAWKAARFDVPLQLIESPYRSVTGPLLKYINIVSQEHQDDHIVVVLPEIVPRLRRHLVLHNQTTALLKLILLLRPRNRIVISMPFHLER